MRQPRDKFEADDYNPKKLDDFGANLEIEWFNGIVIPTSDLSPRIKNEKLTEFDVDEHDYVIVQPVAVGPPIHRKVNFPGEEPVYTYMHAARESDSPGESYKLDHHRIDQTQLSRNSIDRLARTHSVVEQNHNGRNTPGHWQNPDNDPENFLERAKFLLHRSNAIKYSCTKCTLILTCDLRIN